MRRPLWLAAGAALGAGGTVWTRRRLERLSRRVRPSSLAGDMAAVADRSRRSTSERVRAALDAGRAGARAREDDLWHDLTVAASERGTRPRAQGHDYPTPAALRPRSPHHRPSR